MPGGYALALPNGLASGIEKLLKVTIKCSVSFSWKCAEEVRPTDAPAPKEGVNGRPSPEDGHSSLGPGLRWK